MDKLKQYSKFIVAAGLVAVAIGHALVDGSISGQEWSEIIASGAAAFGVYVVPNVKPSA